MRFLDVTAVKETGRSTTFMPQLGYFGYIESNSKVTTTIEDNAKKQSSVVVENKLYYRVTKCIQLPFKIYIL